jgi:hypothetical protein
LGTATSWFHEIWDKPLEDGVNVVGPVHECRAERTSSQSSRRWVPGAVFVLFVAGLWATTAYIRSVPVADQFDEVAEFHLWVGLVGALAGFAIAASVYFGVGLIGLLGSVALTERSCVGRMRPRAASLPDCGSGSWLFGVRWVPLPT